MIISLFVMGIAWPIAFLNLANIIKIMDPVNLILLALAVSIFSLRYSIRRKNNMGSNKKNLQF